MSEKRALYSRYPNDPAIRVFFVIIEKNIATAVKGNAKNLKRL